MANPPITIGPFHTVPAPGSPIRSDWPQDISTVVTDHANRIPALEARNRVYGGKFTLNSDAGGNLTIAGVNPQGRAVLSAHVQLDLTNLQFYWNLAPKQMPYVGYQMSPNGLNIECKVWAVKEGGTIVSTGAATWTGFWTLVTS